MTRPKNMEVRIKCKKCKEFTQSVEPISIKKLKQNIYDIRAKCTICGHLKIKRLNEQQRKLLPDEIINLSDNSEVTNNIEKEGGIFPLLALIPAIAAGISALGSIGGVAANTIIGAKKAAEDRRHNEQMEQIAKDVASGKGFNQVEDENKFEQSLKYLQGKGF